jgi:hypothetical protein
MSATKGNFSVSNPISIKIDVSSSPLPSQTALEQIYAHILIEALNDDASKE